jgi:ABC-2 type transport system ATP-binding protein
MDNVIELKNINKQFKDFRINNVSFNVKKGFITGLIGSNGSGKSTTIRMIMNLIKQDSGEINIFGLQGSRVEREIKERIGFVYDDNVFYDALTIKEIKRIIAPAYKQWDDLQFNKYIDLFELPTNKRIKSFSKGMKMKTSLAFALSHHAELIIMDEPTSGLDPVFRRELLDLLRDIMLGGDKTIFFSTHITTDLDRIADYITFIQNGDHIFSKEFSEIDHKYAIVKGEMALLDQDIEQLFVSSKTSNVGFEALTDRIPEVEALLGSNVLIEKASLEDIMFYTKRGVKNA